MLMPSGKPLYENVSSKEYYDKVSELREKALNGCIQIAFPDFEEVVLLAEGQPAAAIRQSKRWLTVGDELVDAAENKAIAAEGKMAVYELPRNVLEIFVHMQVHTMVETELGEHMTAGMLVSFLEGDKTTCVLKIEDAGVTAYVFLNYGKLAGAAFESPEGRSYGDAAVSAMGRFKEHAYVAIYFMEPSPKYLKTKVEAQAVDLAHLPLAESEHTRPFPAESAMPEARSLMQAIWQPFPPAVTGIKLTVALSFDEGIGLTNRSRQQVLEVFEEGNVAWVDGKTLSLAGPSANLVLPGSREFHVTLKEASMGPQESRYILLPRKLRSRLSISEGATLEVKVSPQASP